MKHYEYRKPNKRLIQSAYIKADYIQILNGDTLYRMRKGKEQNNSK
jgi:beta-N-acetylglucosaminidase